MRTALAVVLALLVAVPAAAKKPGEPPPGPRVLYYAQGGASGGPRIVIDSDGNLYMVRIEQPTDIFSVVLGEVTFVRNIFGGPPPSPIVNTTGN